MTFLSRNCACFRNSSISSADNCHGLESTSIRNRDRSFQNLTSRFVSAKGQKRSRITVIVGVWVLNLGDSVPLSFTQVPIWRVEMSMGARVVDVTFVISAVVAAPAPAAAAAAAVEAGVVVSVSLTGALRHITSMMEPLLSSTVSTVRRSYSSRVRM